jgi:MFS family permease
MAEHGAAVTDKIWTKAFTTIFIVNFFMNMGQYMMNTIIPKYAYHMGSEATVVGVVTGMFAVTALASRPFAGPAVDYFRKNRLMTLSIGLITLAFVCYSFSQNITMLIAARLIHGIGMGLTGPLCLAMVSNTLPDTKMASGMGVFSLGAAVASATGPTLGLKLSDAIGYTNTFIICTVLMAICLGFTLLLRSNQPVRTERFKVTLNQIVAPETFMPTLVMLFMALPYTAIHSFIAIYGGLSGVEDIGLFFTASAICLIFIRPVSGRIADKYGFDKTIIPGLVVFIGALIIISFSRTLPMFLLAGVVTAVGYGSSQPVLQAICMQLVPRERRGAAGNTNYMGTDIGFLTGPTIAGAIISAVQNATGSEVLGISVMYRVMILPVLAGIALFALTRKKLDARVRALQETPEPARDETAPCETQKN